MKQRIPLSLIYNEKSGFHSKDEPLWKYLKTCFEQYGFEVEAFEFESEHTFDEHLTQIKKKHEDLENRGVVVAAGGDGTLNKVASYLMNTHIPLGIIPLGTFNYVAKQLHIPLELDDAIKVIATGITKTTHVAKVNEYIYLNNASLGVYPLFILRREYYNRFLGRFKIHAYLSALDVLVRPYKNLALIVTIDGKSQEISTPLVFLGNNSLQLQEMQLDIADQVEQGKIGGVIVSRHTKRELFALIVQFFKRQIKDSKKVHSFNASEVTVKKAKGHTIYLALDGEFKKVQSPLHFSVEKNALKVIVPNVITSI